MIPVQNIYYMLAYAYRSLQENGYKKLATEKFENIADMFSAILCRGVSLQIKRGLGRAYIEKTEALSSPRGKIEIVSSIKTNTHLKKKLICTVDDFSVNSYMNCIIKTTMCELLKSNLNKGRKKELRKLLVFFDGIDVLDKHHINWKLRYDRNNHTYHLLISVCYFIINGLLLTNTNGNTTHPDFFDEQKMHSLYENFILEYYKKEHPELHTSAPNINWKTDDCGYLLPQMKSDIVIANKCTKKTLIIDAKYYRHNLQTNTQYMTKSIHSGNLYQIFTYVKNWNVSLDETVSGMLLYARTEDSLQPHNQQYTIDGNNFFIKTLDLNCDFSEIKKQLDAIAQLIKD